MTLTSTPATSTEAAASTGIDGRDYVWLTAEDAARDPQTPEQYLIETGLHSSEQLAAMLERRPVSDRFVGQLVSWTARMSRSGGGKNALVAAALNLPGLQTPQLVRLTEALDRWGEEFYDTARAVLAHPSCTEHVAATLLCIASGAFGSGERLEQETGSAGFLAAAALRLVRTEKERPAATPNQARQATLDVVAELADAVADTPAVRPVLAALGPGWSGDRSELLEVSRSIATN